MNEIISKIENQLIGDNGIATQIRLGEGLNENDAHELYANLDLLKKEISTDKLIPIEFMLLVTECISTIYSSFDYNQNHQEKILFFIDRFLEKLRSLNQ